MTVDEMTARFRECLVGYMRDCDPQAAVTVAFSSARSRSAATVFMNSSGPERVLALSSVLDSVLSTDDDPEHGEFMPLQLRSTLELCQRDLNSIGLGGDVTQASTTIPESWDASQ